MFLIISFGNCKKDANTSVKYSYNYFPTEVGTWIIYNVDSITFDDFYNPIRVDTSNFQLKEVIESTFIDNENRKAQRIEIYKRYTQTDSWIINRVYYQVLTKNIAERVEENLRFIKLIFPPKINMTWKGNSFIVYEDKLGCDFLGDWNYKYVKVDEPKTINLFQFDSTLTVLQVDDSNAVCRNFVKECYATNVGLVSKKLIRLWSGSINPLLPFAKRAGRGYILNYEISAYGKN